MNDIYSHYQDSIKRIINAVGDLGLGDGESNAVNISQNVIFHISNMILQ